MNLLITGAWAQAKDYIEEISEKHNVVFMQWEKDELPCDYDWVEGVVCNGLFLSHPIEKFTNLRFIQLTSVGYDRVPMDYIKEHNIELHNAKGVYSIPMAEFAIAGVLQLYKQMRFFYENQKQHKWEKHRGLLELYGKTVCIIGCGDVGTECAKRFKAFGCSVIGVNRTIRENDAFDIIRSLDSLDEVSCEADIIIIAIAETEHTKHIISDERIHQLKNTTIIINLSRGSIIDTTALVDNMNNIGGAVLDVFEIEPLNENSLLWGKDNVIITPHNSFVGDNTNTRLSELIISNIGDNK